MSQNIQNTENSNEGSHSELVPNKEDEVVFLYRIVPSNGESKSHGLWCASIAGLPSHTIERGKCILHCHHISLAHLNHGSCLSRSQIQKYGTH